MENKYPYVNVILGFTFVGLLFALPLALWFPEEIKWSIIGIKVISAFLVALCCSAKKYTQDNVYPVLCLHMIFIIITLFGCLLLLREAIDLINFIIYFIPLGILGVITAFTNIVLFLPYSLNQNTDSLD
ncbi:hypothetical protein [Glaesserella sp.]|uniref:hypothetical protein n=1 Tax=Glaesserella sp. TaxID=2094731 RepID=UPI0035A0E6FF